LDASAVDRLAALTVPKTGFGYYVPPLGGGEEALVNILPVTLPEEIFVSSTPHTAKKAAAILLDGDQPPRFDWAIKGGTFWSFCDPRDSVCRNIVDLDQVETIDTSTQMNQKLPIPIRAARAVGEVLKYVTDQKVSSDYARYI
jgi:hypothetical protein